MNALKQNLFIHNPEIVYLDFFNNKFRFIYADILKLLKGLTYANFKSNPCIYVEAKTQTEIDVEQVVRL